MSNAGYLLDTNVVSEGRRKKPDVGFVAFMESIQGERSFLSVLTIGELRKGAAMRSRFDVRGGAHLGLWIDEVEHSFSGRILPVDLPAARLWGELSATRPRATIDTLIAATAIVRGMILVTRNLSNVRDTGVTVINPWNPMV